MRTANDSMVAGFDRNDGTCGRNNGNRWIDCGIRNGARSTMTSCAVMTVCAVVYGCGGGMPIETPTLVAHQTAGPSLQLYQGHGVYAPFTGLEPSVIAENGVVRIWYTAENNTGAAGNYPFSGQRIAYGEISEAEFSAGFASGDLPAVWQDAGDCVDGLVHSEVFKGPAGEYDMLGVNLRTGAVDWWQSATGYPGTWSLTQAGAIRMLNELGNVAAHWNGTAWDVLVELQQGGIWAVSAWSGASLGALSMVNPDAQRLGNGAAASVGDLLQVGPQYVHITHDATVGVGNTPTGLALWTSASAASGWTLQSWILRTSDLVGFMGDPAQPFDSDSQLADPAVFEVNGRACVLYETIRHELTDVPSLSVGCWPSDLPSTIKQYAGQEA